MDSMGTTSILLFNGDFSTRVCRAIFEYSDNPDKLSALGSRSGITTFSYFGNFLRAFSAMAIQFSDDFTASLCFSDMSRMSVILDMSLQGAPNTNKLCSLTAICSMTLSSRLLAGKRALGQSLEEQ